ncbi:MAG: tRNA 2-thiocytidine biosynthesis TtcA family protein [Candidatus Woesearchaeota archaeon]|nr:tRNA 2-thiocytidine biosynthesis TtcA family protein [Candidatus Woesearchaeota archaeon]MDP7457524.1 tRNA 2-thiocytidine biosynthesis TtcA family protein [Candidatus Woesearchaeota archaeon]
MSQICMVQIEQEIPYNASFVKRFEQQVVHTIKQHNLLDKKEKILVAVSGGKDSTAMLYLLHKLGYALEAITVDAKIGCYSAENLENIKKYCGSLGIPLHVISFRDHFGGSLCYLQDVLKEKGVDLKSCTTCGVLRRHLLNIHAKRLGADKLVMGHNMDDEVQALLMNYMKNHLEKCARMGPLVGSAKNDFFVRRVKPFYFMEEKDIVKYAKMMKFPVKYAVCPCASGGFRYKLREFLRGFENNHPSYLKNFMQHFVTVLPLLQKQYLQKTGRKEFRFCSDCQEPSLQARCRSCEIIGHFKT